MQPIILPVAYDELDPRKAARRRRPADERPNRRWPPKLLRPGF
jgi:hypothetical protein